MAVLVLERRYVRIVFCTYLKANVYYATTAEGKQMAIKIYKTSILVFKDRERYVTGEFRFRKGSQNIKQI